MPSESLEEIDLMVVDDDEISYRDLRAAIADIGMRWRQAHDGHRALELTVTRPTKLWLANMRLPDMSGIDLMKLVKAIRSGTPFFLVSDEYSIEEEKAARAAGAAGYFSKPVETMCVEICVATVASQLVRAGPRNSSNRQQHHWPATIHANAKPLL